ncbi:MAG: hypothetical protein IJC77_04655 [Bacteroidaceae bacterium]|nr:hypothetical protein [Bacteroidaceae bacterium]
MNKKIYITPEVRIEELELINMVATSIGVGESLENVTADTKGHRGSWGNLWDEE